MTTSNNTLAILKTAFARAAWADAWSSAMEEAGRSSELSGQEITEIMPPVPDDALHMARTALFDFERINGVPCGAAACVCQRGKAPCSQDMASFAHCLYMESAGHGVGFGDGPGRDYIRDCFQLPSVGMGADNLRAIADEMLGG